jgi:hypothetical protein
MTRRAIPPRARAAAWALALLAAGCGPGDGNQRYIPAAADARQALTVALDAWAQGRPAGPIEEASPPVVVCDSLRRPGQCLRRYDILGEVPGEGPRQFAVRLVLDDPPEEKKVRFVVFGIRPLWVYRLEDYEMFTHWACGGSTEKAPDTGPSSAREAP